MKPLRLDEFREQFNQACDSVRVVTIFSPTCLVCHYGQSVVSELFEEIDTKTLKGFSVWLPIMDGDNLESAQVGSQSIPDDRVEHRWDPERQLGELFAKTLNLKGIAWDVCLLYAPDVIWSTYQPPQPTFWMHQLPSVTGADGKLQLSPGRFAHELLTLLGNADAHMAWDLASSYTLRLLVRCREREFSPHWRKFSRRLTLQYEIKGGHNDV